MSFFGFRKQLGRFSNRKHLWFVWKYTGKLTSSYLYSYHTNWFLQRGSRHHSEKRRLTQPVLVWIAESASTTQNEAKPLFLSYRTSVSYFPYSVFSRRNLPMLILQLLWPVEDLMQYYQGFFHLVPPGLSVPPSSITALVQPLYPTILHLHQELPNVQTTTGRNNPGLPQTHIF